MVWVSFLVAAWLPDRKVGWAGKVLVLYCEQAMFLSFSHSLPPVLAFRLPVTKPSIRTLPLSNANQTHSSLFLHLSSVTSHLGLWSLPVQGVLDVHDKL